MPYRNELRVEPGAGTTWAPWFVIPASHEWFRDPAISEIVADAMSLRTRPAHVDLAEIRRKYHAAQHERRHAG